MFRRIDPLVFVGQRGEDESMPGKMSLIMTVPAAVPSLIQSSVPWTRSSAEKKSVPLTSTGNPTPPGNPKPLIFVIRTVPAAVPSLRHNCLPKTPSSAMK